MDSGVCCLNYSNKKVILHCHHSSWEGAFLRTFWHATGLNWAEEEQVIARQIDLSLFIQKMSQDEKERIMISGLLSLVKVETFCLISLILRYGSEAKNQIRIREELLLKKHTCWGHSSKTILYTYSWRLGFPKYDFYCRETIEYFKEFDSLKISS